MKNTPLFPLAKLGPLGFLTAAGLIGTLFTLRSPQFANIENYWVGLCLLPLVLYLGNCHYRARRLINAEQGAERVIIKKGFAVMVANRAARFWASVFSVIAGSTCIAAVIAWGYQAYLWYRDGVWMPLTWLSIGGEIPQTDFAYVQRLLFWLGDTNIGVMILVVGLLLAAPIAAVNTRAEQKARLRKRELTNLKKTPHALIEP